MLTGGVPVSLLAFAGSSVAQVTIPSEFDTSLDSVSVAFRGSAGMTLGYMSQPKAAGARPGIVLFHDIAGLTAAMRGVARNLATSGYTVVAPDFVSPRGGTASFRGVAAEVERAVAATPATAMTAQATGALTYAKSHGGSGGKGLSVVGFGWGGTQALLFAAGRTDIAACVAFYPDPQQVVQVLPKLQVPLLAIFAGDDPATKAGVERIEHAAVSPRRPRTVKVIPGVMRGFHDPGAAKLYKADAAKEAWTLVIQHLDANAKQAAATGA
jgi:carboxymethylenebutenolidase